MIELIIYNRAYRKEWIQKQNYALSLSLSPPPLCVCLCVPCMYVAYVDKKLMPLILSISIDIKLLFIFFLLKNNYFHHFLKSIYFLRMSYLNLICRGCHLDHILPLTQSLSDPYQLTTYPTPWSFSVNKLDKTIA